MEMEQSIYIVLTNTEGELKGEEVAIISNEAIVEIKTLVLESESLGRKAEKLRNKSEKSKRSARKLLDRIVASHGIKLDNNKQAVGVSKETDEIYVGEKNRVIENPESNPGFGDKVVGKITKQERRKYNELIEHSNNLVSMIAEHNALVQLNENGLIAFETSVLTGKEYDKEKQHLLVSTITGKVYLVTKE